MFCGNCGKEIPNNMRFCVHCGAEQNAVVTLPSASAPSIVDSAEATETQDNFSETSISASETAASIPAASESAESVPAANDNSQSVPSESVPIKGVPTPNVIPTSSAAAPISSVGASAHFSSAQTAVPPIVPVSTGAVSLTVAAKKTQSPDKKYSLKHLVMCLAAAAVMAVAAGVFAALYFLG